MVCYCFSDTYVSRLPNESFDDRNIREFMTCYEYFTDHLALRSIKVVILSDNPDFLKNIRVKCENKLLLATGEEYVSQMTEQFKDLEDKLCRIPFNEDEGAHLYYLFGLL